MAEHKRVVAVAIDESEFSEKALQWYVENIRRDDDYVVLIHTPELYDLSMASPAVVDQLLRELTEYACIYSFQVRPWSISCCEN
ncbi:hypothetical protein DPMN_118414 [Dreissena polymorpha]|uniref:UspA domain-containing protein n=1 Tax=Dreissena polymorpha TaxID=45954 RepID=A0A9D4JLW2_DREPO|nr:hypothetical protein DPMN_118414 [Dreissena polymorpha]